MDREQRRTRGQRRGPAVVGGGNKGIILNLRHVKLQINYLTWNNACVTSLDEREVLVSIRVKSGGAHLRHLLVR